ncbi:hypothetical protein EJ07DRAFT_180462 [Lizonia empirigonia]|nr:hypothetical protein EJ07DRAFT_180462 [Lizonia empirigonia]
MSPAIKKKKDGLGAGLRVSKDNIAAHPAGPPKYGELTQAERAFTLASTFLSGVLAISASQFLGAPLKLIDPQFYEGYMAYTKECFAILITCLTQWWAPTIVRVSGDSSMVGQLIQKKDGSLECNFADRMVLMANHQLYTDWLYIWWIAYTNNMHGFIYIILKESLRNIPIIGWSAQFYNFIFLARNWEDDQRRFKKALTRLNDATRPMWLIIFPEGTNLSATTREKSKAWATKNNLQDMKHQLLPRSTGLKFCLNELKDTTEWLYDCTIAYEGVPPGQFGQDIFTLRSTFFEGRPPKSVNMHWRRFHIDDIPIQNTKAFEVWLRNRWREKDYMLEYFQKHTRFPRRIFGKITSTWATAIETQVKSGNWNEFVKIFAPISSVMMALTVAYGANPADLIPGGKEFFEQHMKQLLGGGGDMGGLPSPDQLEKMIEGAAKLGAAQAADPQQVPQVAALTQENLAKLVKETALKHGAVMPGGMRRASTALPQAPTKTLATPTAVPSRAKREIVTPSSARKPAGAPARPKPTTAGPAKPKATSVKPKAAAKPKPTPPTGPMKEITLASGVSIKVPASAVDEAKKSSATTVKTANGLVLQVGKKDVEKAQEKKGDTVMTASGIPIKVTSSGELEVAKKPIPAKASPAPKPTVKRLAAAPTKTPQKLGASTGTSKKLAASGPKKIAAKPPSLPAKAPAKVPAK